MFANPARPIACLAVLMGACFGCSGDDAPTGSPAAASSSASTGFSSGNVASADSSTSVSAGSGGGGASAGASTGSGGGDAGAGGSTGSGGGGTVPVCANGTVASYLGTSCSQGETVYHWLSYTCTSSPTSICDALGINGSHVGMKMDPNGPHTILVGATTLWDVTAGQSVDVIIHGTVYGSKSNLNWPHFGQNLPPMLPGQTGDGIEENITTVGCAASGNCLDANNGVSDILCSPTSPIANCTDQTNDVVYQPYGAKFNPAPPENPYPLTIEIKLNANTGTASLRSVGTHL